jgi:hypothetical protein
MTAVYCRAHSKQTGNRCRNRITPPAVVCRFHGGASPRARARVNLLRTQAGALQAIRKHQQRARQDTWHCEGCTCHNTATG